MLSLENFEMIDITNSLQDIDPFQQSSTLSGKLLKALNKLGYLFFYINKPIAPKQAIDILNSQFLNSEYYALFTNLNFSKNKANLNTILQLLKSQSLFNCTPAYNLIVFDSTAVNY
jgi:hypothetical protein